MSAVGELVLVLGLLVSAHCAVRARDPEVEEEELGEGGLPPYPGVTETPLLRGTGRSPARTGNWCAFVQKRVLMVAEACRTHRHVLKDQSPCSSGSPGCQRITYRLSMHPTFCQKKKVITSLLWRCCPGHGGPNCEDEVSGLQPDSGGSEPEGTKVQFPDDPAGLQLQRRADPNREQNDHQTSFTAPFDPNNPRSSAHPDQDPGKPPSHHNHPVYHHQGQNQQPSRKPSQIPEGKVLPYPDIPAVLPVPDMMALVISQLQPILEGFNRSLEHLNQQVGVLAQDVAELKSSQQVVELQEEKETKVELDAKLDEVFQQIKDVRRQFEEQRSNMENRLHSQHDKLHQNLSSFRMDVDQKLKHQQMELQVSLQGLNPTLAGKRLDQDQIPEDPPEIQLSLRHPTDNTALWEAITQLDNMVVNNTAKVDKLMEDMEVSSADVEQLTQQLKDLEKLINQTARKSQILFMETGLEVEQARVSVLQRVEELARNVTLHEQRLQESDADVDYLYTELYRYNLSTDCNCGGLNTAVAHLKRGVANVTQLANENRLALEENSEVGGTLWGGAGDWEPAVEALQRDLQQVNESVASKQNRTRTLELSLTHLSSSISALQEVDVQQENQVKMLSVSFRSLLQDAIRHSDVLQLLLGEEVLEFLEWPIQDQEAHSIPALKEQVRELQEQLRSQKEARKLQDRGAGSREEVLSADQPSHSLPHSPTGGSRRTSGGVPVRENQLLLLHPEMKQHAGDGSDLWNLEKNVGQLEQRVVQLEGRPCFCNNTPTERGAPPAGVNLQLQEEVMWLKRGLEEHLRVFKNVFSNADVLAASEDTVELDKLRELMKRRGKKKRGRGESEGGGGSHRSRRESAGVPFPSSQSDVSLLFVGGSPRSVSDRSVTLEPSLNLDQFYADTGVFTAPVDGLYLFILALDLRPGSAHMVLRQVENRGGALLFRQQQEVKEAGPVSSVGLLLLRKGEELRLEVRGEWAESENNLVAVLLLQHAT
ncbi:multimerin-2a isoform X1 [Girardinichthys multiradiatus]|uniref:multimerin-2a isoform X1 n=2 Tax=Girardinichthys multiradiatus TaxID=208333 RepID=UPI001FACD017|nr:multimerin-2a isoform X1 [Girardinichthys multiradiatus]